MIEYKGRVEMTNGNDKRKFDIGLEKIATDIFLRKSTEVDII